MKRATAVTLIAVALSMIFTATALASNGEEGGATTGDIALALAPLAAAALAVERIPEMAFARVESTLLDVAKVAGLGGEYVGWAKGVVGEYQEAVRALHEDLRRAQAYTRKKLREFPEAVGNQERGGIDSKRRELAEA